MADPKTFDHWLGDDFIGVAGVDTVGFEHWVGDDFVGALVKAAASGSSSSASSADALTLSDVLSRSAAFTRPLSEPLTLSESVSSQSAFVRSVADAIAIADPAARSVAYIRHVADALSLGDSAVGQLTALLSASAADPLAPGDAVTRSAAFNRSAADALSLGDPASRVSTSSRALAEPFSLTDAAVRAAAFTRSDQDPLALADAVYTLGTFSRSFADALDLADLPARSVAYVRHATDALTLGETVTTLTFQHARPSADLSDGNWTNELGSTTDLYESVNEPTPDDADYIQSESSPSDSTCVLSLGAVTDPGLHTHHSVRYRCKITEGTGALKVELLQGASTVIASHTLSDIQQAWLDGELALSEAEAAAITDYSDLRVRLTANPA